MVVYSGRYRFLYGNNHYYELPTMETYLHKMAYLISLLEQIKRYPEADFESLGDIERTLERPNVGDRDWSAESPRRQAAFRAYLDTHTFICEEVLHSLQQLHELKSTSHED